MVPLSLFCFSAFTWSASSGASVVHNINAYTEESPTKSKGGFVWKESSRVPRAVGKQERTPKILNGEEALVGEFPWMASIHVNNQGHHCGGSIISRRHILTAAHCLSEVREDELRQLTVLVGGHFQNESLEPRAQRITVNKSIKYFDFSVFPLKHDIAILVLEKEIELNNYTAIINLPSREYLYGNVDAKAAGWGKTWGDWPYQHIPQNYKGPPRTTPTPDNSDGNLVSPVLKATNLIIFSNTKCDHEYEGWVNNYRFSNYTMCAGASYLTRDPRPGDTTQGDSGGPLFLKENEKWVVVGITSSGHKTSKPLPGVYTRVSAYLPWIKVQMNIN